MFDKLKTAMRISRLMGAINGDIDNPTKAEQIVTLIILFPLNKKQKMPFDNQYVLADAALLAMVYSVSKAEKYYVNRNDMMNDYPKYIRGRNSYTSFHKDVMQKTFQGIKAMYKVDSFRDDISDMLMYYDEIISSGDMNNFYNEAVNLFIRDITYKGYASYKDESLPLYDIKKRMDIEINTRAYFTALFNTIDRYLA